MQAKLAMAETAQEEADAARQHNLSAPFCLALCPIRESNQNLHTNRPNPTSSVQAISHTSHQHKQPKAVLTARPISAKQSCPTLHPHQRYATWPKIRPPPSRSVWNARNRDSSRPSLNSSGPWFEDQPRKQGNARSFWRRCKPRVVVASDHLGTSKGPMSGRKPTHNMHPEPNPGCISKYTTPWHRSSRQ